LIFSSSLAPDFIVFIPME